MEAYRAFLTGEPGSGKTTAIKETCRILTAHGTKVGGVVSGEIREAGVRVGFSLEDLGTRVTGILAHVNEKEGPRIGKYRVNLGDIQRVAVGAIEHAIAESDIIIVDELGPMELNSTPFIRCVEVALATQKPLLGTIHKRASHSLIEAIESNKSYEIVEVTTQNRDDVPKTLAARIEEEMN